MAAKQDARIIMTPTGRLFFPALFEARAYHENGQAKGDPRWSTGLILEPEQMTQFKEEDETTKEFLPVALSAILLEVAEKTWPEIEDHKAAVKHGGIGWPIKVGDKIVAEKERYEDCLSGKLLISPGSILKYMPALKARVDGKWKTLNRKMSEDEALITNLFSGGNYAYLELNVKGTEAAGKKHLTIYLNTVYFAKPGESIGGGGGVGDRYAETQGGEADVDPYDSASAPGHHPEDDEIPF